MNTKFGLVTLAGEPNVGKSTLLNRLLGEPLAIVSPKPQTTWGVVRGILTQAEGQIVFVDTPGLHHPRDAAGSRLLASARRALLDVDLVYWMADCRRSPESATELYRKHAPPSIPAFLLLNKVDLIPKPQLLPLIDHFHRLSLFQQIIPISALKGDNLDRLLHLTWELLPAGQIMFDPEQISDQPEREFMREFIREQIFLLTRQEIPYSAAVKIESVQEKKEENLVVISATVYVEKESQKGILVGKGGEMVRRIGIAARRRLEDFLGVRVYLDLRVKVRGKWRRRETSLKEFGLGA